MQGHQPRSPKNVASTWSASGATTALLCPARYFWETIIPEPHPENPWAAWGTALHYMFQLFFIPNRSTGRYPYQELDSFLGTWKGLWWGAVGQRNPYNSLEKYDSKRNRNRKRPNQPVEVAWSSDRQSSYMFHSGREVLAKFHRRYVLRRMDGVTRLVETRFSGLKWKGVRLNGVIDRLDIHPTGGLILDYKNSFHTRPDLEGGIQLTMYQVAYEFLRLSGKISGQVPLKGMFIFNYRRCEPQPAPLRSPEQIEQLYQSLLHLKFYWEAVLFGKQYPAELVGHLSPLSLQDMATGEASPIIPRGKHCDYCRAYRQCREWENKERPRARQAFAEYHQLRREATMPNQITLLPILQPPQGTNRGTEYVQMTKLVLPNQPDLDNLVVPPIDRPKARPRKRKAS